MYDGYDVDNSDDKYTVFNMIIRARPRCMGAPGRLIT
jgi:hypothetical protein